MHLLSAQKTKHEDWWIRVSFIIQSVLVKREKVTLELSNSLKLSFLKKIVKSKNFL